MKTIEQEITSKRTPDGQMLAKAVVVGKIQIAQFDSLDEAVSQLGKDKCLALINSQHKTDQMNTARENAVGKPSKDTIKSLAFARITTEEFAACQGDRAKIEALLESKSAEVEKELAAQKAAQQATLQVATDQSNEAAGETANV